MLTTIIQLWVLGIIAATVAWWRSRGEERRQRARTLQRLLGLGVAAGIWEWMGTLPYGGWPAKIAVLAATVYGIVWYARVRVIPAMDIWWQQFLSLHRLASNSEDPRDVGRLRWPELQVSYEAISPYLDPRRAA